jgi:hypothetical protein
MSEAIFDQEKIDFAGPFFCFVLKYRSQRRGGTLPGSPVVYNGRLAALNGFEESTRAVKMAFISGVL